MKNITLIGSSNCRIMGGFVTPFLDAGINLSNFSVPGMGAAAKIYELKRKRNQEALLNSELIIIESNIIDATNSDYPLEKNLRDILFLGEELFALKRRVLILLLPCFDDERSKTVRKAYRQICEIFGFNFIDLFAFYKKNDILDFFMSHPDPFHQLFALMQTIAKNILASFNSFKKPKNKTFTRGADFKICSLEAMLKHSNITLQSHKKKNFFDDEVVYRLGGGGGVNSTSRLNLMALNCFVCIVLLWIKPRVITMFLPLTAVLKFLTRTKASSNPQDLCVRLM